MTVNATTIYMKKYANIFGLSDLFFFAFQQLKSLILIT